MVTAFGVVALTFMMAMYTLEGRGRLCILGFSLGCAMSSSYGVLSGAWPFGVIEAAWGCDRPAPVRVQRGRHLELIAVAPRLAGQAGGRRRCQWRTRSL